jgi:adhesin transport system membrane fusion protein
LIKSGAASEVDILRLQREISEIQGKINLFQSNALQEYNKIKGEMDALNASRQADLDRLNRTTCTISS